MTAPVTLPTMPSSRLDGRRALVTGASRGLGLAMAAARAEAGAHVTLAARGGDEVEAVAEAIRQRGDDAEALMLDVTDTARVTEELAARKPFQILVNSAGTNRPAELLEITEEDYDAVTDLNVLAAGFLTKAVAQGLTSPQLPGSPITVP